MVSSRQYIVYEKPCESVVLILLYKIGSMIYVLNLILCGKSNYNDKHVTNRFFEDLTLDRLYMYYIISVDGIERPDMLSVSL